MNQTSPTSSFLRNRSLNAKLCHVKLCHVKLWHRWVVFALLLAFALPVSAQDYAFKIIVHKDNPRTEFTQKDLDKIFLKRDKSWEHGGTIEPINQSIDSAVRDAFSEEVHGRSTSSIESYWQRQIFSGRGVPPDVINGDASVIAYIAGRAGAIGYVSRGAQIPSTVKVITITGEK